MSLIAYYLDNRHPVTQSRLDALCIESCHCDPAQFDTNETLQKLCIQRGYTYRDFFDLTQIPDLVTKLQTFLTEHLHQHEEIRFFCNGSGYFDVRDEFDQDHRWIRLHCHPGDLLVLPAGCYHRFSPDDKMSFHVMRLFCG